MTTTGLFLLPIFLYFDEGELIVVEEVTTITTVVVKGVLFFIQCNN